jgi:hypothetical protein
MTNPQNIESCSEIFPNCRIYDTPCSLLSGDCENDWLGLEISDGPCLFLKNFADDGGRCVSKNMIRTCSVFKNENQCNEGLISNWNCIWNNENECIYESSIYYVSVEGVDDNLCGSDIRPCNTLDYVMEYFVNQPEKISTVFIESGTYDYKYLLITNKNCRFDVNGYFFSPGLLDDIFKYPLIKCDGDNSPYFFTFLSFTSVSFNQLNFFLGDKSNSQMFLFRSFFFFFLISFIFNSY